MPSSTELLRNSLNEWSLLYGGRLLEDAEVEAWMRIFSNARPDVLAEALEEVTKNSERRPTPGTLSAAIRAAWEKRPAPGAPRFKADSDANLTPCWFWDDDPATPTYRAKDCPEGRVFLALLEEMAAKKSISETPREKQAGTFDCRHCRHRYPIREFLEHKCSARITEGAAWTNRIVCANCATE